MLKHRIKRPRDLTTLIALAGGLFVTVLFFWISFHEFRQQSTSETAVAVESFQPPQLQPAQTELTGNKFVDLAIERKPGGDSVAARTGPRALVPSFDTDATEVNFERYFAQLPAGRSATLADWESIIKNLPPDARRTVAIPIGSGHVVTSIGLDQGGRLWLGTEGEGLFQYDSSRPISSQWKRFTKNEGLAEDTISSLACDVKGRMWVGHPSRGLTIYNGESWQVYGVCKDSVGSGSKVGPLSEQVSRIVTTKPEFGSEVWICGNCGITRYNPISEKWSYLTQLDGLSSEQICSVAFDHEGRAYIATKNDGIFVGVPTSNYRIVKHIPGPSDSPRLPLGTGLPSSCANDILVGDDDTIYVATNSGVAWSVDHGNEWHYQRGQDYSEIVRGRYQSAPSDWTPASGALLNEDYCTALSEDNNGYILVAHRSKPIQRFARQLAGYPVDVGGTSYALSIFTWGNGNLVSGNSDSGLNILELAKSSSTSRSGALSTAIPFPSEAGTVTFEDIDAYRAWYVSSKRDYSLVSLGEDWGTRGDWVGRYGRQYAVLCAADSPFDCIPSNGNDYSVAGSVGPHSRPGESLRHWLFSERTDDPNSLWDPIIGTRRESEWDDHGETYPRAWEGPDLWITIGLPEGLFRASLYFYSPNSHLVGKYRDYRVKVRHLGNSVDSDPGGSDVIVRTGSIANGVYEQFAISGPGTYQFVVEKGTSLNAILNGVFIDRISGPTSDIDKMKIFGLGSINYDTPTIKSRNGDSKLSTAVDLITGVEGIAYPQTLRRLAYRYVSSIENDGDLLKSLRWRLPIWTYVDRSEWKNAMATGFASFLKQNEFYAKQIHANSDSSRGP